MRFLYLIFFLSLTLISGFCFAEKPRNSSDVKNYKFFSNCQIDTVKKKETLIGKIKKAFQFRSNFKKAEEERINAIFDKLSVLNNSKKKDTVTYKYYKTETIPIKAIQSQIDSLFKNFSSSINLNQDSSKDIDQLADKLLPMMLRKIELEKIEEKKQEKLKKIRELMPYSGGAIITTKLNGITTKIIKKKILRKGEVFGFHSYSMNKNYLNYNYKALTTLLYYGYELNGETGGYKSLNGWDTAEVVDKAKKANCKVLLCVFSKDIKNTNQFLNNENAQINLVNDINILLKQRNANGVNLIFDEFGINNRVKFTNFIRLFSENIKKSYQLTLTLPVIDKNKNYDVDELDRYIQYFIIDFSKKHSYGSISPIKGTNFSLDSGIDRYLNSSVEPKKFIACLTYNGINWEYKTPNSSYQSYKTIINKYLTNKIPLYNKNEGARIDVLDQKKDTINQIWYDDAQTLSEKYDFIFAKGVGGIGIWGLGSDDENPELWNVLIDKTMYIETKTVVPKQPKPIKEKTFFDDLISLNDEISEEIKLYELLFDKPCEFAKNKDKSYKLYGVRKYGKNYENNAEFKKNKKIKIKILFNKIPKIMTILNCILFVALISVAIFCNRQVRSLGNEWGKNKLFYGILIILIILLAISIMLLLFVDPSFNAFGTSPENCETSLGTILKILGTGFLVGLLSMQFLVFPMIQPRDIP